MAPGAGWVSGVACGTLIGLVLTLVFFNPPPRANSLGMSRWEVAKRIDYVGGVLAASGLTLFLMALTWSGNQYPWGQSACPGMYDPRHHSLHRLRRLGNVVCAMAHVSRATKAEPSRPRRHPHHHLRFWCQLLRCARLLADAVTNLSGAAMIQSRMA